MNLEQEAYEGELKKLRDFHKLVRHTVQFGDIYFICGEGGEKDQNNLPERIHICAAYGCDWFQVYQKMDTTHGPGW